METTAESRTAYLEKMRYRSYFIWLQKAVGKLYGISEPITAENLSFLHHTSDWIFFSYAIKRDC